MKESVESINQILENKAEHDNKNTETKKLELNEKSIQSVFLFILRFVIKQNFIIL